MFDYMLVSVEPSTTADRGATESWHRYVIGNGITSIEGYRPGSREEVVAYAEECIRRLNALHKTPMRW